MEDSVVKPVDMLLKDNLIRNLKKKLHQNQTKKKTLYTRKLEEIIFKWFFAKFSIFSNDGYLGWRPGSSDTILKEDDLKTIQP